MNTRLSDLSNEELAKKRIVSIDFDGVLARYEGFVGEDVFGEPLSGAKEFIERIIAAGFCPIVFTTRRPGGIIEWLKRFEFPEMEVTNTKYPSIVYVDDRNIQFKGSFEQLITDVKEFDVYWRRKDRKIFENF